MHNAKYKHSVILSWMAFVMYAVATFTKINYSASISFLIKENIFTKTQSGVIAAAFYLVYGVGQIFCAKLIDKYSPYRVGIVGLLGCLACNAALCLTCSYEWVLLLWTLNGAFGWVFWPGLVRMVSECVHPVERKFATNLLTTSIAVGGILSYLCTSPILERFGWSGVFALNSIVILITLVLWLCVMFYTEKVLYKVKTESKNNSVMPVGDFIKLSFKSGLILLTLVLFIRAILDNGLKTWFPTMMMESYNISTVTAGIQTALVYIFNIAGMFLITPVISKMKNESTMTAVLLIAVLPFACIMLKIGNVHQLLAFGAFAVITTLTYTLNGVQVMISSAFAEKGLNCSGSVAALLNGFASLGVLAASVFFGYVAENYNWYSVVLIAVILIIAALFICLPAYFMWKKFKSSNQSN